MNVIMLLAYRSTIVDILLILRPLIVIALRGFVCCDRNFA